MVYTIQCFLLSIISLLLLLLLLLILQILYHYCFPLCNGEPHTGAALRDSQEAKTLQMTKTFLTQLWVGSWAVKRAGPWQTAPLHET